MTTTFLVLGLLFPRLMLGWCWFAGTMPANDTPFAADVLAYFLCPRLLVAYWTLQTPGVHIIWTILYVLLFLSAGTGQATARMRTRTSGGGA